MPSQFISSLSVISFQQLIRQKLVNLAQQKGGFVMGFLHLIAVCIWWLLLTIGEVFIGAFVILLMIIDWLFIRRR